MNLFRTRLLFRFSCNSIKNHNLKLYKRFSGTFTRYSLASYPRHFSIGKEIPQDLQNEFDGFEHVCEPNYHEANVDEITGGDPEQAKLLNLCQIEINVMAQSGSQVPAKMTTEFWCELLKLSGKTQRIRYLRFLWLNEQKDKNYRRKKQQNRQKYLEMKAARGPKDRVTDLSTNAPVKYGLSDVSLVHRIRDAEMNRLYNSKLLHAMLYGPQILVDCSYEPYMSPKEINLCVKQLLFMWSENRLCNYPFDVIFCNLKKSSYMMKKLSKTLLGIHDDPAFPFNYTENSYLDLYPKENLVYLTPHCKETLNEFNGNDIYIIGAMVDKSHCEPISLAKAKRDGIRFAKLPLDLHLNWKMGVKSLTLNQCLAIMNDIKDGRDWPYAFRHVPRRKVGELLDEEIKEKRDTRYTAKSIRERYRRNQVYDLLIPTKSS